MYRAVFIDWDDTIGDWQGVARQSQHELYDKYHLDEWFSGFEQWFEAYNTHNTVLWERYGKGEITKDYLYLDHFLYPLRTQVGLSETAVPQLFRDRALQMADEYVELTNKHARLIDGTAEVVRYLAQKYPLTIVSNGFVECQEYKVGRSGLQACFRHIVLSEEVGIPKPNPLIFEKALELNRTELPDLQANEVVMIGDSFTSDIAGAKAAGIDTIWIWQRETTELQRATATHIVPKLEDVKTWL